MPGVIILPPLVLVSAQSRGKEISPSQMQMRDLLQAERERINFAMNFAICVRVLNSYHDLPQHFAHKHLSENAVW